MSRKKAREVAFKLLYQTQINKEDIGSQIELYYSENEVEESSKEYIGNTVLGVTADQQNIDNELKKYLASSWTIDRISKVDVAILRLAYFEIKFLNDVPKGVAINEAVELAKKFSDDQAGKFINGVLANIDE